MVLGSYDSYTLNSYARGYGTHDITGIARSDQDDLPNIKWKGDPYMKVFVGWDVSKTKFDVCFLSRDDDHNSILYQTTVGNSDAVASHIKQSILQFHEELSFDKIVLGMEVTGLYSLLPSFYFSQDPDIQMINVQMVAENPRTIHRFSKAWTDDKNDRLDAQLIAEFLSTGKYNAALPRYD